MPHETPKYAYLDHQERIPSQGILEDTSAALLKGIMVNSETGDIAVGDGPGLVITFSGSDGEEHRISLMISGGQKLIDLIVNALGLILPEDGIEKVGAFIDNLCGEMMKEGRQSALHEVAKGLNIDDLEEEK